MFTEDLLTHGHLGQFHRLLASFKLINLHCLLALQIKSLHILTCLIHLGERLVTQGRHNGSTLLLCMRAILSRSDQANVLLITLSSIFSYGLLLFFDLPFGRQLYRTQLLVVSKLGSDLLLLLSPHERVVFSTLSVRELKPHLVLETLHIFYFLIFQLQQLLHFQRKNKCNF